MQQQMPGFRVPCTNRFLLWIPKLIPKDSLSDKFTDSFLTSSTWKYNREMYQVSAPTHSSGFFQISSSIDNVKHIFVYLQRNKTNNADANPYHFDTFKLIRLIMLLLIIVI